MTARGLALPGPDGKKETTVNIFWSSKVKTLNVAQSFARSEQIT